MGLRALVAAPMVASVAGIGQYWGKYDETCLNDWSKVSPIMRDDASDGFFRTTVWIHALVFCLFMVIYPIQWLRAKPVDGRNLRWHTLLGNVIKYWGGRWWTKPLCQSASAVSFLYHCFAIPTLIHMAFNYDDEDMAGDYNKYTREMAAETVCIIFPLPAFDAINMFLLHRRFALFNPNEVGSAQARHAWIQHHKFEMTLVCIMLLFVLPGMWVAHDAYWFFSTPGIQNWLVRFAIQASLPYAYLMYPRNLRFLLSYIFFESSSRLSDKQIMLDKSTTVA